MPFPDAFDIAAGTPDPNASDEPNWENVSRIVHLHLAAAQQQAKAQEQAVRYSGQQEFQSLVSGGATPEEALRRTAHKLYYNNPEHMIAALRLSQAKKALPLETVSKEGQTYYRTGPNSFAHVPAAGRGAIPLDAAANIEIAKGDLVAKERALREARKAEAAAYTKDAKAEAHNATNLALGEFLRAQDERRNVSTNWMGAASAPAVPPNIAARVAATPAVSAPGPVLTQSGPGGLTMSRDPMVLANPTGEPTPVATEDTAPPDQLPPDQGSMTPPVTDTVVVIKDGKKFNLPKSQLDDAIKQGYKLVQ